MYSYILSLSMWTIAIISAIIAIGTYLVSIRIINESMKYEKLTMLVVMMVLITGLPVVIGNGLIAIISLSMGIITLLMS